MLLKRWFIIQRIEHFSNLNPNKTNKEFKDQQQTISTLYGNQSQPSQPHREREPSPMIGTKFPYYTKRKENTRNWARII